MALLKKLGKNIILDLEKAGDLVSKVHNINPAYFIKRGFVEHAAYFCSRKAEKIIRLLEKEGRFIEKVPGIRINHSFIHRRGLKESISYYS